MEMRKETLQRVLDQTWKMGALGAQFTKEAERNAVNFLFVMNGSGILAVFTLLGAFHKTISVISLAWMLLALCTLTAGILLATYITLRVMKISGILSDRLLTYARMQELMIGGIEESDESEILKPIEDFRTRIIPRESRADVIHITIAYVLFCISVGFLVNCLLYINLSTSFHLGWLYGIGIAGGMSILMIIMILDTLMNSPRDLRCTLERQALF